MNNMRIFLFVGTIDALMSIIGYMYYRHYLPFGRTLTFGLIYLLMALGTAISVILPQGTPHFLLKLDRRTLDCFLLLHTSVGHHSSSLPAFQ